MEVILGPCVATPLVGEKGSSEIHGPSAETVQMFICSRSRGPSMCDHSRGLWDV